MSVTTASSFTATIIIATYSFTNIINLYFITLIYEYYKIKIIVVPIDGTLIFLVKTLSQNSMGKPSWMFRGVG